jgi:putative ABC transport system permease protein
LALLGAAGGIAITSGAIRALVYLAPPGVPRLEEAAINPAVLLFAVGIVLVCGIGFGSIPALSLSRTDLASSMGSSRTTHSRRARLQSIVVVGELALATVLVFGGVLLARTVPALNTVDPGFNQSGFIVASLATPSQLREGTTEERESALDGYMQQMHDEVLALPGVSDVAFTSSPPFFGWRGNNDVRSEGWQQGDEAIIAERRFVSVGFFATLGIPIVEGLPLFAAIAALPPARRTTRVDRWWPSSRSRRSERAALRQRVAAYRIRSQSSQTV